MTLAFMQHVPIKTPVLFLVFNRPEITSQVFESIRQAKPPRLYVAADGPRLGREGEADLVARTRAIATAVDWSCEVKTLFRNENLGCKYAVIGAISWFFEHEEQGIILEDDCLPSRDFFIFCENLLDRYAEDERISTITGNNFQNNNQRGDASYYFSKYNHCWGWAGWRRSWQCYQGDLRFWPEWSASEDWTQHTPDKVERRYWQTIFDRVHQGQIDSWAYPWTACVWFHGGLTATPNVNLISNIGFGVDATHTLGNDSPYSKMETHHLSCLSHPNLIQQDVIADRYTFDYVFGGRLKRFPYFLYYFPGRVVRKLSRMFKKAWQSD